MRKETLYDEYMKDEEFARIMAQENLIMGVTEDVCKILKEDQLTRSKFAHIMGKTRGYVSQLLNGRRNITLRVLSDIAYRLGYHVNIIFKARIAKSEQLSLKLDWDMSQKNILPENKVNVADDYISFGPKISHLGS